MNNVDGRYSDPSLDFHHLQGFSVISPYAFNTRVDELHPGERRITALRRPVLLSLFF